jgi:preprotein translocase YajC subunit
MTPTPALLHFVVVATSSKSSSSSSLLTLLPLLAIGVLGYFFFIRPQQRKAQAAKQAQGAGIEVGDEVQTVGGVIGTVLEIHGDRYTLLTGALGDDGNLDGPQPTRIVFVRQAIARKIEPIEDVRGVDVAHDVDEDESPSSNGSASASNTSNGSGESANSGGDIDDVGGDNAASRGERSGESEEA